MSNKKKQLENIIHFLKADISQVTYPQSFTGTFVEGTNCLAYAVGYKFPDVMRKLYFPGAIRNRPVMYNKDFLLRFFIEDLSVIGIKAKVISKEQARETVVEGNQVVAFMYSYDDFHFIRKDKDGMWSHKQGYYNLPTKVFYDYEDWFEEYMLVAYLNLSFK